MLMIKIAEIFRSIQGEGLYQGVPSIFVRTFGCNKTCSGFSMPRGEKSLERFNILPESLEKFEDAKLVKTGCDSYMSWDPRFKDFSPLMTIKEIVDKIQSLLRDGVFSQDCHLILTGGEPLLGWQKQYPELFDEIYSRNMNLSDLTFETNGTQLISNELLLSLASNFRKYKLRTTFSVSSKLPCSGETWESSILPEVVMNYTMVPGSQTYLKFVVSTYEDVNDAKKAVKEFRDDGFEGSVYLMPVGGTNDVYELNDRRVAELAIENGFRFSPRLQVPLFRNAWGK
jgi:7-carboxy-7-deazaguanine synthase